MLALLISRVQPSDEAVTAALGEHADLHAAPAHRHEHSDDSDHFHASGSSHFMCRVCGNSLFDARDYVPGAVLSGPRVMGIKEEPELGRDGVLHVLTRGEGGQGATTALFRAGSNVVQGAASENPLFAGYNQRQVACARCGQPVGWRFEKGAPASASTVSAGGGAGSDFQQPAGGVSTSSASLHVVPYSASEEDARLRLLDGVCLTLPKGWWTYEYCHKRVMLQYHKDAADGKVDPRWSLGDFDVHGRVERARPISAAAGYYTSHFFVGGQRCDETGKGRATEVQFFCCGAGAKPSHSLPGTPVTAPIMPTSSSTTAAFVADIEEPALCRYRVKVCVPDLCTSAPAAPRATEPAEADRVATQAPAELEEAAPATPPPTDTDVTAPANTASTTINPTYDPSTMPSPLFIAAAWNAVMGDGSDVYASLAGGDMATGIAPVRFG